MHCTLIFFDKFRILRSAGYTQHPSPTSNHAGLVEYNVISSRTKSSTNTHVN